MFCIVLFHEKRKVWGKDIVIELEAGHLAEPSKTLLGISVSLRVEFHSSSKDLTSRAGPPQVQTPLCRVLLSLTGLLGPIEHTPASGPWNALAVPLPTTPISLQRPLFSTVSQSLALLPYILLTGRLLYSTSLSLICLDIFNISFLN